MPEPGHCPQCGATLPPDAPPGICPKCLLGLGLGSPDVSEPNLAATAPPTPAGRFAAPQPAELAPHFPHLEILELLGQGGMGAVYKARQRQLNRLVALKILPPEVAQDPAFAERFQREAQALAQLSHPQIVSVYDSGKANGLYFFVMEFVDGLNLRRMLAEGKLAPGEALAIVPQICEALQYAHDEGVVHRDIKPENILLDKKGRVKIADFGLARLMGASRPDITLTGTQQVMGTPHYMAPEQMERPQTVDHRADIYSLGVVFYEMLTGELPLGRFQPPSKKVEVDVRLDEVVLRSLEKEPERRYQQVSSVKSDVEMITRTGLSPARSSLPSATESTAPATQAGAPTWQTWWFEQTPSTRMMLKAGIGIFAVLSLIWFISFEFHGSKDSSSFEMGVGDSWLVYRTGEPIRFDPLNWSFMSGFVVVAMLIALWRVRVAETRFAAGSSSTPATLTDHRQGKAPDTTPESSAGPLLPGHVIAGLRISGGLLVLLGILGGTMGFIGLGVAFLMSFRVMPHLSNVLGFVGMLVLGVLVASGGSCVFRQRGYRAALLGSLLSFALALMMNLDERQNALFILGFVPGAVALFYLLQPEVKAGFELNDKSGGARPAAYAKGAASPALPIASTIDEEALEAARDQVRIPAIGLIVLGAIQCVLFGAVLLVGLFFVGFWALRASPREMRTDDPMWNQGYVPEHGATMELEKVPEQTTPPAEGTPLQPVPPSERRPTVVPETPAPDILTPPGD
jgi:serine/threonine protein kinase